MCSFLQLVGDKWGKSGSRGWCVIPRDDPLVLYVYAAPQVMPPPAPPGLGPLTVWGRVQGAGRVSTVGPICWMRKPRPSEDMVPASHRISGFQSWTHTLGHNCSALKGQPVLFFLDTLLPATLPHECAGSERWVCGCDLQMTETVGLNGRTAAHSSFLPPRIFVLTPPFPCWATR